MNSFQHFVRSQQLWRCPRILLLLLFTCFIATPAVGQVMLDGEGWPRQFDLSGAKVTIYQPQTESFSNDRIEARAAFSVTPAGEGPLFGAMWFWSRAETDTDERLIRFSGLTVQDIKFPEGDEEKIERFRQDLNEKFIDLDFTMSLDRFLADLATSVGGAAADPKYQNDAPVLFFETEPTVLVLIDGEPILADTGGGKYKYVVNTAYFIARDPSQSLYYLKGGNWWYESTEVERGWSPVLMPPKGISDLADQLFTGDTEDEDTSLAGLDTPPKIIVSTQPAELIVSNGEPDFRSVEDTNLLYWDNSEGDVLMDIDTNIYFVLVSGRWFKSASVASGDWEFVPAGELPESFKSIPEDSAMASVRTSVAGTEEAREAILENTIPQTAEINRRTATAAVSYDGDPEFVVIDGTEVQYAVNADKQVLKINERFYLVDEGVWFDSARPMGPWEVSTEVPDEVNDIPPDSPVYPVKYVYIYDYTPEVVYVGYTPGYYGSYVYGGTVIYGTGYYYSPWYRSYYYPRPVTYGFGVHYNPYSGWGFSLGVSFGWLNIGFSSGWGYWGHSGYRYGYRHGYYHGARHGYYAGRRNGYISGYAAGRTIGYRATARTTQYNRYAATNAYTRRANGVNRSSVRISATASVARANATTATTLNNNIYSDRNGNIYRRDNNGSWQQRSNGDWGSSEMAGTYSQRSSGTSSGSTQRSTQQNLNRSYDARSRGTQRTQSYRSARPSGGRAGGGRRR